MTDTSFYDARIYQEQLALLFEQQRPFILLKPRLFKDGNQYCALYGDDLMTGVSGFGDTADAATRDFDRNWLMTKATI